MRLNAPTIERLLRFKKGLTQDQKQLLLSITKNLTPGQTLELPKTPKQITIKKTNNKKEGKIVAIKPQQVKPPSQLEYINEQKHKRITQKIKKTNYAGRTISKQESIHQAPTKKEAKQPNNSKKYQITNNGPFFDYDPGYVRQYSRTTLSFLVRANYKT